MLAYVTPVKISDMDEGSFLPPLHSVYIVAYLLKARTVEPETQLFLGNARMQQ
jgi:hypothetical protein